MHDNKSSIYAKHKMYSVYVSWSSYLVIRHVKDIAEATTTDVVDDLIGELERVLK